MSIEERLQISGKQAEIELYYELLCSGYSVGEILNAVSPTRSKSERSDSARLEQPQSKVDGAANVVSETTLVNATEAKVLSTPGLHIAHGLESCRTGVPQVRDQWLNETGSGDGQQLISVIMPVSRPDIVISSGADTSISHGREVDSGDPKRLRFSKFPSVAKRVAFLAFYMAAISSLSIASFLIMHPSRDTEPRTTSTLLDVPSQLVAAAIPRPAAAHFEAAVEFLTPRMPVSASPQEIEAGAQETISEIQREMEVAPLSATNQFGTTQHSADPATAPRDPEHEPIQLVIHFPSTTSTGSVETTGHSDTGQPDMREPPEVPPTNGAKGTATMPTGIVSATLPSRAHAAKRHKVKTPHQYTESPRQISQPASIYYGSSQGSYYRSFDRGYGYGGPSPHSDAGG